MGKYTEKLRKKLIQQGISQSYLDDVIDRLKKMLAANIDAAWGEHPVQHCLQSKAKKTLCAADGCANLNSLGKIKDKRLLGDRSKK
jgi:hypothetical protein